MFDDDCYYPDFDLGAFRYAVARYVKLLIRARWQCQPGFLQPEVLAGWNLGDIQHDAYPAWRLLEEAAAALAELNTSFLPRCGSGGVRMTDESTPEGRLIGAVAFLAQTDGGGPYHNQALLQAASRLWEGQDVDWDSLVNWSQLPGIRVDLDQLPHPQRAKIRPRQQVGPAPANEGQAPGNIFRKEVDDWNIRYDGGTLFAQEDSGGLFYIRYLLEHPRQRCTVTELFLAWAKYQATQRSRGVDGTSGGFAADEGIRTDSSLDDGLVLDEEGMERCREEYLRIRREKEAAEANHDTARLTQLCEEEQKLEKAITEAYKPSGSPQKVGDQRKRHLDRVTKAIGRAIEKIGKKDPLLARHLLTSLKTGYLCTYDPEKPTTWNR